MTMQEVDLGTHPTGEGGDSPRSGFDKVNKNFTELALSIKAVNDEKLGKTANAASATKLQIAKTISITGDATGSTTFDGSKDESINLSINTFNGSTKGLVPPSDNSTAKFLRADGAFAVPPSGGGGVSKEYVDEQVATRLGKTENAVSASIWKTARTLTVTGSASGSTSFNGSANFTLNLSIPSFSGSSSGLVPAATSGDANKVLSGAGTWVAQSGGGGSSNAETAKKLVKPDGMDFVSYSASTATEDAVVLHANRLIFSKYPSSIWSDGNRFINFGLTTVGFEATAVPISGGRYNLGSTNLTWKDCYLQNAPIVTSDLNAKTEIVDIGAAERACAVDIRKCIKKYKLKSAVAAKGSEARYHFGVIAQEVIAVFERHGLDAFTYGIVCYSEWEAKSAEVDGVEEGAGSAYAIRYDELSMFLLAAL